MYNVLQSELIMSFYAAHTSVERLASNVDDSKVLLLTYRCDRNFSFKSIEYCSFLFDEYKKYFIYIVIKRTLYLVSAVFHVEQQYNFCLAETSCKYAINKFMVN